MNLKDLEKQLTRFRVATETALGEASKAIEAEEFETAQTKQTEADEYMAKATVIEKQISSMKSTESDEEPDPEPEPKTQKNAQRLPFTEDGNGDEENDVTKAINYLKLGDIDKQANVLLKELYGNDYANTRVKQHQVFNKFVRTGRFDTGDDEKLLKTVVLTPEQVIDGVKQDTSYKTMKATLQEVAGELGGYENIKFAGNMDNRVIAYA